MSDTIPSYVGEVIITRLVSGLSLSAFSICNGDMELLIPKSSNKSGII